MGTITIKVPKNIRVKYEVDSLENTEMLLEKIAEIMRQPELTESDRLLGLFANEAEFLDQITESAMQARTRDSLRVS